MMMPDFLSVPRNNSSIVVLVIAGDEGDRIAQTVQALREAFGDARVIVADGGSI